MPYQPKQNYAKPFGRFLDKLRWEVCLEGHNEAMLRFGTFTAKSWLSHKPWGDHHPVFHFLETQIGANPKIGQHLDYR